MPSYQQLREVRFKSFTTTERDAEWPGPPGDLVIFNTTTQRLEIYLDETWQAFIEDPDAEDITYAPAVATDWDSDTDPGDLDDALDQLAERIDDNEILIAAHGPGQHTEGTAWRLTYLNASGDETEIVLGADGTFLESNGASAAPAFRAVVAADLSDFDATAVSAVGTADDYLKNDANDETTGDLTVANLITAGDVDGIDVSAHDVATTGVHGIGSSIKQTLLLMAASGVPATTAGCSAQTQLEFGTNDVDVIVLDFASDGTEYAVWNVVMPDNYDGGTVQAKFIWTANKADNTMDVRWQLQARAYGDAETLDQAYGGAGDQGVTDTCTATAYQLLISGELGTALTIAGSPAGGEYVAFRAHRDHDHGDDDLDVDARLLGIKIEYSISDLGA